MRGVLTPIGIFPLTAFRWGSATGTTAGELLQVAYSNGPITAATIELADGRELELAVDVPDVVSVLLPPDTPDGWAQITGTLEDGTVVRTRVYLTGVVVKPPDAGGFKLGPGRRRRELQVITSPSRIVVGSTTEIHVRRRAPARVVLRSRTLIDTRLPASRRLELGAQLELGVLTVVSVRQVGASRLELASSSRVARRGVEEALLLLGLL